MSDPAAAALRTVERETAARAVERSAFDEAVAAEVAERLSADEGARRSIWGCPVPVKRKGSDVD